MQAYNNLNSHHPNTHFLSWNTPGNDGVTFHTIQEQDESNSIGVESLTVGYFATQGNNQGRGGCCGFACGSGRGSRCVQSSSMDLSKIQCFRCHQ